SDDKSGRNVQTGDGWRHPRHHLAMRPLATSRTVPGAI
ncbi:hypothetical protein A2U01_0110877, partial [Trifolium medium]|nr:hypothetical protein [Trifolium medium]